MATVKSQPTQRSLATRAVLAAFAVAATAIILSACSGSSKEANPTQAASSSTASAPTAGSSATPSASASAAVTIAPTDLKLLKVTPDNGVSGTAFTISGEGLPADKDVEVSWATADGSYNLTATAENVQFIGKVYTNKRLSVGKGHVGTDGKVSISTAAPEDFGEVHDVFLRVDGQDVARGGFRIMRKVTMSPESGPIGTPITLTISGLSYAQYSSVIAVRYDNMPTGIVTGTTTRGVSQAVFRAAGKAGKHVIDVEHGARSVPYLNNPQSGTANIPDSRFWFTITDDKTMPANMLDWPDQSKLATVSSAVPRTTASNVPANPNVTVQPSSSPILTNATVTAKGLTPNTEVQLFWVTAHGNRVSPSGWSLGDTLLTKATVGADGNVSVTFQVPDDLGGWHVVKVALGDKTVAELPYFIQHSLVGVTPQKVKAGDEFVVHLKGIGWTELDNGVATTYDNAFIGFACGFNSQGDVTMTFVATGEPGIHLIDIYPMVYQGGKGEIPWGYQWPLLSYKVDAPGLALGYNLPAYRLAVEVTN
jgi:hypothetical protein